MKILFIILVLIAASMPNAATRAQDFPGLKGVRPPPGQVPVIGEVPALGRSRQKQDSPIVEPIEPPPPLPPVIELPKKPDPCPPERPIC